MGALWFVIALPAIVIHPVTTAAVYAVVAGLAARQIVRAWGSVSWQSDVAVVLGAAPVVAALGGVSAAVAALIATLVVAIVAALAPGGGRLPGVTGRAAAAGILALAVVPGAGGAAVVLVREASLASAVVLFLMASVYEVGDYIVGSGGSTPIEGPLAGAAAAILVGLPLAMVLVAPFDETGTALLLIAAAAAPLGQLVASAALPRPAAPAPALRRIDTMLVLAPVWVVASQVI